ncbi:MAG TPA: hypothetical protein VF443_11200, partial [Nitrospira sp.]
MLQSAHGRWLSRVFGEGMNVLALVLGLLMAVANPGALNVPTDTQGITSTILSPVDGSVLAEPDLCPCEVGGILPSGIMALVNKNAGSTAQSLKLFSPDMGYPLIIE